MNTERTTRTTMISFFSIGAGLLLTMQAAPGCTDNSLDPGRSTDGEEVDCPASCSGNNTMWACPLSNGSEGVTEYVCAETRSGATSACNSARPGFSLGSYDPYPSTCASNQGSYDTESYVSAPSSAITYDAMADVYEIDEAFFSDLMSDPGKLLTDSARVTSASPYYKLDDVATGDLVEELGLQDGDKLINVNNQTLKYDHEVFSVFLSLQGETSFTLKVYNWALGGLREIDYDVVP